MELPPSGHEPVLLEETVRLLAPGPGKALVDCTLGRAGHALALASHLGRSALLIGLDADPRNLEYARNQLAGAACPVRLFHANFGELEDVLAAAQTEQVDAILADLGVSTNQLFDPAY